jgi:hypothetical protein
MPELNRLLDAGRRVRLAALSLILLTALGCSLSAWAVLAHRQGQEAASPVTDTLSNMGSAQGATDNPRRPPRRRNLSLQPEAARLACKLGRRYYTSGLEVTTLSGTLLMGSEQQAVQVTRVPVDDGERLEITLDGRVTFTWRPSGGVKEAGGALASDAHRAIVERLALDTADQFVLAQLRGASYRLLARAMRPVPDGGADGYHGPLYDVVSVTEPSRGGAARVDVDGGAASRLYYINSETGLIEKIVSEEDGVEVSAELTDWVTRNGETLPSRVTWRRAGAVVMEFALTSSAFGADR